MAAAKILQEAGGQLEKPGEDDAASKDASAK
jgi:hypothetical protein